MLGRQQCAKCQRSFNSAHIVRDGYDMPALPPPLTAQVKGHTARAWGVYGCPHTTHTAFSLRLFSVSQECPQGHQDDCPASRGELTRRDDDNEATIQRRLGVYKQAVAPLLAFYEGRVRARVLLLAACTRSCCSFSPLAAPHAIDALAHATVYACAQGVLRSFNVKKGIQDAPALQEAMIESDD